MAIQTSGVCKEKATFFEFDKLMTARQVRIIFYYRPQQEPVGSYFNMDSHWEPVVTSSCTRFYGEWEDTFFVPCASSIWAHFAECIHFSSKGQMKPWFHRYSPSGAAT